MTSARAAMSSHEGAIEAMEVVSICAVCQSRAIAQVDSECNLCRCRQCGYVFDSPRPSQEDIIAFYSRAEKYDSWVNESAARDALWRRRLEMLLPYCAPGNLLDVGAGIGQFLHHARPYFTRVAGTEVSDSAVRIAEERYGLAIHPGRLEDLKLPDSFYDTVTLFHVLEHVADPARLVRRCHQLLRPGGALVIAVPNDVLAWGSRAKRVGRKLGLPQFRKFSRSLGIPRAGTSSEIHLSHFTASVLRELVTNCGFTIVKEGLDPYYASAGLRALGDALYCSLHRMLFFFRLNRYEAMWLVARKQASAQPYKRRVVSSLRELQRNWEGLAQSDPLWAICTDPARRNGRWDRDDFFATGKDEMATVMACLASLQLKADGNAPALDFGCGVGRLTRAMADYFSECWGIDISPTMVRLAAEFNRDLPQCRFALNESGDLRKFQDGQFGFVYSSIVLQHIQARHSKRYLSELVRVLKPNGILVVQILDHFRAGVVARWRQALGVRRRLRKLTSRRNGTHSMELHCVREDEVRRVVEFAGAKVVDVRLTNSADPSFNGKLHYLETEPVQGFISKQYCVVKNAATSVKGSSR